MTQPALHVVAGLGRARRLPRRGRTGLPRRAVPRRAPWRDYVTLTKPRIMSLLLITGAGGMFVGAQGVPPLGDLAVMLLGLALACGGASALNHVLDARHRPADGQAHARASGRGRTRPAEPRAGVRAGALGALVRPARALVNVLTAVLALVGNLFYVLVYTRWLKRSTPQNIVIGGAAGAVPPLVGYAAATGNLALARAAPVRDRLLLDAAALLGARAADPARLRERAHPDAAGRPRRARDDAPDRPLLARARRRDAAAGRLAHVRSRVPRRPPLALGAWFLLLAWRLRVEPTPARASGLFHYSLAYLALLFVAMAVDPLLT